jgi:hypothetical protein
MGKDVEDERERAMTRFAGAPSGVGRTMLTSPVASR